VTNMHILAAGVLVGMAALPAQDFGDGKLYQIFSPAAPEVRFLDEGFSNQVVRGKPLSATEERRSLQILKDGTRIENAQTNRLYRDSQGRTRVEATNGVATISDPVTGTRLELNPSTKSARRASAGLEFGIARVANPSAAKAGTPETTENLKPQMVNGVMAQGVRITMTIPKGQIGNNRVIKVVTERWVSSDLQIPVKTTNSDPRFGDTTYQLTGIVQQEPDPALFQIPADYTAIQPGGRGGPSPEPPTGGKTKTSGRGQVPGGRGGGRSDGGK